MLTYSWRDELSDTERREVEDLARRAAEEDAEAGFSGVGSVDSPGSRHLLVRIYPRETGESLGLASTVADADLPLVAHLLLTVAADATGDIRYVVHPDHRSLGVSTLLFERLGLDTDAPDGWVGTGARSLTVWAHGNHPATRRMARRRHARVTRRLWKMTRPFYGELAEPLPDEPLVPGVTLRAMDADRDAAGVRALLDAGRADGSSAGRWTVVDVAEFERTSRLDPADVVVAVAEGAPETVVAAICLEAAGAPTGPGTSGRMRLVVADPGAATPEVREALVVHALHALRGRGFQYASVSVDAEQDDLVKVLTAATVEHEHSDVCYVVP